MRGPRAGSAKNVRQVWRRAPRRWRQAIMVALALALPGSISAGASAGMLPLGAERTSEILDGILAEEQEAALGGFLQPDHLEAVPVGASTVAPPVRAVLTGEEVIETLGEDGIPSVAADAYVRAADRLAVDDPGCGIRWTLLAAIGRVESDHGRFGGARLRDDGYGTRPIRGIPLDGRPNVALIRDTDRGRLDGDTTYDRAVGPMQFIPSTWQSVGVDADGNGARDPDNIFDAAQGAAVYLCRGDADLRDAGARAEAVRLYNRADRYVRVVLDLAEMYESGVVDLLPSVGLPPRRPSPPPRPTPAPPVTSPDPETPLGTGRGAPPAPAADAPGRAPTAPGDATPVPPTADPVPATPPPSTPPTAPAPPPAAPPGSGPAASATTVPAPPPATTPDDTVPPTTATTVPAAPPADTGDDPAPPASDPGGIEPPAEPPAAVGWAPAMREVVVEIIEEGTGDPESTGPESTGSAPTSAPAPAAPAPAAGAPAEVCAPGDAAEAGAGCPAEPPAVPAAPDGGPSSGVPPSPART